MRIFVVFLSCADYNFNFTTILTITHKFNASKKAHLPKVQNLSEDGLLLSKICFLCLERAKIPLKGNKKRRIGTISCILFCILLWRRKRDLSQAERRVSEVKRSATSFRPTEDEAIRLRSQKEKQKGSRRVREPFCCDYQASSRIGGERGIWTLATVIPYYTLSRGAPSASWVFLHIRFDCFFSVAQLYYHKSCI